MAGLVGGRGRRRRPRAFRLRGLRRRAALGTRAAPSPARRSRAFRRGWGRGKRSGRPKAAPNSRSQSQNRPLRPTTRAQSRQRPASRKKRFAKIPPHPARPSLSRFAPRRLFSPPSRPFGRIDPISPAEIRPRPRAEPDGTARSKTARAFRIAPLSFSFSAPPAPPWPTGGKKGGGGGATPFLRRIQSEQDRQSGSREEKKEQKKEKRKKKRKNAAKSPPSFCPIEPLTRSWSANPSYRPRGDGDASARGSGAKPAR